MDGVRKKKKRGYEIQKNKNENSIYFYLTNKPIMRSYVHAESVARDSWSPSAVHNYMLYGRGKHSWIYP